MTAISQRAPVLAGPKASKFTRLKEMIFCDTSSTASSKQETYSSPRLASPRASSSCMMVFDYVQHDLLGIIHKKIKFNSVQVKYIIKEVLEAVDALHSEHIEHGHLKSKTN